MKMSTMTRAHVRKDTVPQVRELTDGTPIVNLGEWGAEITLFFESWQHLSDFANDLLGAASIALTTGSYP